MVKNLTLAGLVIIAALIMTFGIERFFKSDRGDFFILVTDKPVPNFTFQSVDEQTYALYDFAGKTTLIHFWASWCAPCVVEFPELIELANKRHDDLVILAISTDRTPDNINQFFERHDMIIPNNMIVVHDHDKSITEGKFSVFRLPETFIVNGQHRLQRHIIGAYADWANFQE
jgi:thiol-disulfide isomerase/thioredoxin